MVDSPFRPELFTEQGNYEETPLRDRKSDMYGLNPSRMDDGKKAELVRDVIAMANTTCWRRKPAYLLMGLEDRDGSVCGLEEYLNAFGYGHDEADLQAWEAVSRKINEVINNHVIPRPQWDLKHGEVDGKPVAYLIIWPDNLDRPYCVKRQIKNEIVTDQCWIRGGESKGSLKRREFPVTAWSRYVDSPHPLPSDWGRYFENLLSDNTLRDAKEIEYYIELRSGDNNDLKDELEQFLDDQNAQLLAIQGDAGSGKSTFIQRQVLRLAVEGADAVADIFSKEQFLAPPGWIPRHFSLRGRAGVVGTTEELTQALVNSINQSGGFWSERPLKPEGLFEQEKLQWLFCLDGLDELWDDQVQRNFLDSLQGFLSCYPRIKILLTSRPDAISVDWEAMSATRVTHLQPLTEDTIQRYVEAQTESALAEQILAFLRSHEEMWQLCSFPSYLTAAMRKLGQGDESRPQDDVSLIPKIESEQQFTSEGDTDNPAQAMGTLTAVDIPDFSKPITDEMVELEESVQDEDVYADFGIGSVLDSIYDYLWQRECERRRMLSERADEWWEKTGELAIGTDGTYLRFQRDIADKYLQSRELRDWLLSLGILKKDPKGVFLFFTELTKAYYAASYLAVYIDAREMDETQKILQNCKPSFADQVKQILYDISSIDDYSLVTIHPPRGSLWIDLRFVERTFREMSVWLRSLFSSDGG